MHSILRTFDLSGKVALVTGASKGLGNAMAKALAQAGADVVLTARTLPLLEELAQVIEGYGRKALALQCNVGVYDEVQKMVKIAVEEMGKIAVLINNAGMTLNRPFRDLTYEEWETIIHVNLNSVFSACKAVGPHFVKQRRGKVINVSSVLGERATWNSLAYCTSKAALIHFTRALAFEWARYQVNVNSIAPGYFKTEMSDMIEGHPETKKMVIEHIPFGRMGNPEDLDGLAIFLSSSASDYITGQTIFIDGGYLTW